MKTAKSPEQFEGSQEQQDLFNRMYEMLPKLPPGHWWDLTVMEECDREGMRQEVEEAEKRFRERGGYAPWDLEVARKAWEQYHSQHKA